MAELRRLATHCEFGDYLQQALQDRFVCGIGHENTQKRLLTEANLTLTKAIETACSIEAAEVHASQLKGTNGVPVMNVKSTRRHQGRDTREKHGTCTRCGVRIIKQKTVATKMQGVTSVASKGTWQKCAGQSNQVAQHPSPTFSAD